MEDKKTKSRSRNYMADIIYLGFFVAVTALSFEGSIGIETFSIVLFLYGIIYELRHGKRNVS